MRKYCNRKSQADMKIQLLINNKKDQRMRKLYK